MLAQVFIRFKEILCAARHFYVPCNTYRNPRLEKAFRARRSLLPALQAALKTAHAGSGYSHSKA